MRNLYKMLIAAVVLILAAGCQKEEDRVMEMLAGDWHYSGVEHGVQEDVWISFSMSGAFEIYQRIGEGAYWHSKGHYDLDVEDDILSGVYSDKTPWRYDYHYSLNGNSLTMKAVQAESYSVTYSKGTVPSEVKDKALELTKASDGFIPFL